MIILARACRWPFGAPTSNRAIRSLAAQKSSTHHHQDRTGACRIAGECRWWLVVIDNSFLVDSCLQGQGTAAQSGPVYRHLGNHDEVVGPAQQRPPCASLATVLTDECSDGSPMALSSPLTSEHAFASAAQRSPASALNVQWDFDSSL